jgi:hypothetical protein
MKSTEHFKQTVRDYLEQRASEDELFAVTYAKPNKNMEDCITYILNTVRKTGCNGFTDSEIYAMAVHYYDEDHLEVGKNSDCRVIVNHTVELTEAEKEQARQDAIRKAQDEAYRQLTKRPPKPSTKPIAVPNQRSLFD